MVNSVTHLWGKRRFSTSDDSRNNLWIALATGGEGRHNIHHAHPVSARHGLTWYEIDVHYYGILLLQKLGLAGHVKTASLRPATETPAMPESRDAVRTSMGPSHGGGAVANRRNYARRGTGQSRPVVSHSSGARPCVVHAVAVRTSAPSFACNSIARASFSRSSQRWVAWC